MNGNKKRTTISLSRQTKEELDKIRHPGQSCDGLFKELIRFWVEEHETKETSARKD